MKWITWKWIVIFTSKNQIYLPMWKSCYCYGYIINHAFVLVQKITSNLKTIFETILKWNGLGFHWYSYNIQNITWLRGDTKFFLLELKNIFQHLKRKFCILTRICNSFSLCFSLGRHAGVLLHWSWIHRGSSHGKSRHYHLILYIFWS